MFDLLNIKMMLEKEENTSWTSHIVLVDKSIVSDEKHPGLTESSLSPGIDMWLVSPHDVLPICLSFTFTLHKVYFSLLYCSPNCAFCCCTISFLCFVYMDLLIYALLCHVDFIILFFWGEIILESPQGLVISYAHVVFCVFFCSLLCLLWKIFKSIFLKFRRCSLDPCDSNFFFFLSNNNSSYSFEIIVLVLFN